MPLCEAQLPLTEAQLPLNEAQLPLCRAQLPLCEAQLLCREMFKYALPRHILPKKSAGRGTAATCDSLIGTRSSFKIKI